VNARFIGIFNAGQHARGQASPHRWRQKPGQVLGGLVVGDGGGCGAVAGEPELLVAVEDVRGPAGGQDAQVGGEVLGRVERHRAPGGEEAVREVGGLPAGRVGRRGDAVDLGQVVE